jgi:hypothetical protein
LVNISRKNSGTKGKMPVEKYKEEKERGSRQNGSKYGKMLVEKCKYKLVNISRKINCKRKNASRNNESKKGKC